MVDTMNTTRTLHYGQPVRFSPAWAPYQTPESPQVGDEGVVLSGYTLGGDVAVRLDKDESGTITHWVRPMWLEPVPSTPEAVIRDLGSEISSLQMAAAVDMVETSSLGHYIKCQGQIEAFDAVMELLADLDG